MSIIAQDQELLDKHCFVYCGPERCNCKAGQLNHIIIPDFEDSIRKGREQQRKEVEEKDKEHQYDRAMEILDKDSKPKDVG